MEHKVLHPSTRFGCYLPSHSQWLHFLLNEPSKKGKTQFSMRPGRFSRLHPHPLDLPTERRMETRRYFELPTHAHTSMLHKVISANIFIGNLRELLDSGKCRSGTIDNALANGLSGPRRDYVINFTVLMENPFFPSNRFQFVVCRSIFHTNQLFPNQISIMDQLQNTKVS